MNNVAKEFYSKLNKVRKLSAKESESLVTKDIVDKLAPHGISGTKDDGHVLEAEVKLYRDSSQWG